MSIQQAHVRLAPLPKRADPAGDIVLALVLTLFLRKTGGARKTPGR
jgi:hypothetical protein